MAGPRAANDALNRIRRFYKAVTVTPVEGGHGVLLDGRAVKTPAKAELVLPTLAAAELVAAEWDAQAEHIDYAYMPATRHAFTAIDRVSVTRAEVAKEVARYAGADLLCYFAEAPAALTARQMAEWGAVLDWALASEGLAFVRATGISYAVQPPQTLAQIEAMALELDNLHLAALAFAGALFGSTILALAVLRGHLDAEAAYDLSRLDEAFQEEQWGVDDEAAQRTRAQRTEAAALGQWLKALSADKN